MAAHVEDAERRTAWVSGLYGQHGGKGQLWNPASVSEDTPKRRGRQRESVLRMSLLSTSLWTTGEGNIDSAFSTRDTARAALSVIQLGCASNLVILLI